MINDELQKVMCDQIQKQLLIKIILNKKNTCVLKIFIIYLQSLNIN